MKRYAWLLAIGVLASAGTLLVARTARREAPAPEAVAEVETVTLALALGEAGLEPPTATVPKDRRVALAVSNHRSQAVTLVLQGYEDRFRAGPIAPDETWRGEFVADRPGEAFAWVVDGTPLGRLSVTGSHLVEGHR